MRYLLLRNGLINEIKRFATLEDFEKYRSEYLASFSRGLDLIDLFKSGKLDLDS